MVFLWVALLATSTFSVGGDVVGESQLNHSTITYDFTNQSYGSNYGSSKYDDYFHVTSHLITQGVWVGDYDNLSITQTDLYQYNSNISYTTRVIFNLELAPSEDNDELLFDMTLECYKNGNLHEVTNVYLDNISFKVQKSNSSSQTWYLPAVYSRDNFQVNGGSLYSSVAMGDFVGLNDFVLQYDIHFLNDYYYDTFYDEGYDKGYEDAITNDENINFDKQQAYEQGFEEGKEAGVSEYLASEEHQENIETTQTIAHDIGYQEGYVAGLNAGGTAQQMNTIFTGILDIGLMPVNFFLKILNFEVFGINIGGFVTGLFTISIIVILFRMFFGGNGGSKE